MVDQTNLNTAMMLNNELQQIEMAVAIFDAGGRIVSMTVSSAIDQEPARSTLVQTATMAYPQQMIAAIRDNLAARETEIRDQLQSLGVTGVEAPIGREAHK